MVLRRLFTMYQLHWYIFRYWWQREFCTFNGTLFDFIFKHCHFLLLQWKGAKYDQRYIDHIWIDRSTHDWLEMLQKTNVICCFLFRFLIWVFPQNSVKMTNLLQLLLWLPTGCFFINSHWLFKDFGAGTNMLNVVHTMPCNCRDRPLQLWNFLEFFRNFLERKGETRHRIYIVNQTDTLPFNRHCCSDICFTFSFCSKFPANLC